MDFVRDWSEKTEIPAVRFASWIGIARKPTKASRRARLKRLEEKKLRSRRKG